MGAFSTKSSPGTDSCVFRGLRAAKSDQRLCASPWVEGHYWGTRCVGPSLGICLTGKSEYFTIPGKCVRRGNITCRLKVLLEMGDQAQCDYYTCAQCRHNIDCTGFNQVT